MFSINQRVIYKLKPKRIGIVERKELVQGSEGERVNYILKYSEYNIPVHAEGHLLEAADE